MFPVLSSKAQDSIRQISDAIHNRIHVRIAPISIVRLLTRTVLSWLEPVRGSERAAQRLARSVAIVIGIALSMQSTAIGEGVIRPIQSLKEIAAYQLPIKQEACHNEIVHRESSWRAHVRNGSHVGYYQGRTKYLINKPDDVQFYWYWHYVSNRYGVDDEVPDYCSALNHLKRNGWQ